MAEINIIGCGNPNYSKYTQYTKSVLAKNRFDWDFECSLYCLRSDQIELLYKDLSEKEELTETEEAVLGYCDWTLHSPVYDPDEEDARNYYHSRDEYMEDDDDDYDDFDDEDDEYDEEYEDE